MDAYFTLCEDVIIHHFFQIEQQVNLTSEAVESQNWLRATELWETTESVVEQVTHTQMKCNSKIVLIFSDQIVCDSSLLTHNPTFCHPLIPNVFFLKDYFLKIRFSFE
jgi:hypothetical protein